MNDGLTATDVMALTGGGNNKGGIWNNGFLELIALSMIGGGGFGFGNRGAVGCNGVDEAVFLRGLEIQTLHDQLRDNTDNVKDGFYSANTGMLNGFNTIQRDLCSDMANIVRSVDDVGHMMKDCCCDVNRNIDAIRYEAAANTCQITNAVHAEAEATRGMINANTIQNLRDRLEDKDRALMMSNFQISQQHQTASLIDELRPCAKPMYPTCSPYVVTNACGVC